MHPAASIVFFTTAAGAGYGLFAWLGVLAPFGVLPPAAWFAVAALGLATALSAAGLLSSFAHLGRPERAWRAFSQWRTSWLSREGVVSVATFVPAAIFGVAWLVGGARGMLFVFSGLAMAAMALVTLYCTAMIYRSLKPVHQWANAWVVPNYFALGLMCGALWLAALRALFGAPSIVAALAAIVAIVAAAILKLRYWGFIDEVPGRATPESATGLGAQGKVRFFESPHTGENYLLREMGYHVARKHAARLRQIALAAGFGAPLVLTVLAALAPQRWSAAAALLAALSAMLGVLVERWLFFAEAKHTVTLYYGATQV